MRETDIRLETRGLAAGYNGKAVIREVEVTVRPGEVLAVIGPNGAGKSTLLKSIAGQLCPAAGTILLCGRELGSISPAEAAEQMSALFTGRPSAELMTCREVAAGGRYPYTGRLGILTADDWEKVDAAMARLGASELEDLPFDGISDGQRQRVLLARALCQEPEVLVLDEPASYLDIRYQLELAAALRSLAEEERLAVIVCLHELDLVRRCADRVLCVKDGRVDRLGSTEEIFAGDYLEKLFDLPPGSLRGESGGNPEKETDLAEVPAAGRLELYVRSGGKRLRCGYTTGTCAALAAAGAARRLLFGAWRETVSLVTPKGVAVRVPLEETEAGEGFARCGVRKDAGDDVDVTAGLLICAEVRMGKPAELLCGGRAGAREEEFREEAPDAGMQKEPVIHILGGTGVGRVTRPGLDQPVGEAAVNSVPRRMIREAVEEVCRAADVCGEFTVEIFVPGGAEAAKKTFNPKLGVEGGISILGTSGIVEPMSRQALTDTIALELRQHYDEGARGVIFTPGNYGADFLRGQGWDALGIPVVRCSNFIGEALDEVRTLGFEEVLLAGHIGKLVKLAGGIMNTHSGQADCRRELFVAYAALAGADAEILHRLMDCATADACVDVLLEQGDGPEKGALLRAVTDGLTRAVGERISERAGEACRAGAVIFSNVRGILGETETAKRLIAEWEQKKGGGNGR